MSKPKVDSDILNSIANRTLYHITQMIHLANHRSDKEKGDPKVGGHQAACASSLQILGALHLFVRKGYDKIAVKPHASPTDHCYHFLLDIFLDKNLKKLSLEDTLHAMHSLRAFPHDDKPVFQSYHSHYDPDHHCFLPTGTVGIPPVNLGYLAHAYKFAKRHGYQVPEDAHFWALLGDSEFREGSLYEALPDFAERELGNLTWIIDYNRQSLDGHRITNKSIMGGTDAYRIERTAIANGWEVIQLKHGKLREKLFTLPNGDIFKTFLEQELEDYELQALLLVKDPKDLKEEIIKRHKKLEGFLKNVKEIDLQKGLQDLGGHNFDGLIEAMQKSKIDTKRPTIIIAHTLKGWGLSVAGAQGNHSSLIQEKEVL